MGVSNPPLALPDIQGVPGDVVARYCDGWASRVSDETWNSLFKIAKEHWECLQRLAGDAATGAADVPWWRSLSDDERQYWLDRAVQELARGPWASRATLGLTRHRS